MRRNIIKIFGIITLAAVIFVNVFFVLNCFITEAKADKPYGNNRYGDCIPCWGSGGTMVFMHCYDQEEHYCIDSECTFGTCY